MGWLIGLDEAGYGPSLGPLVITATLWETPGVPRGCDGYALLSDAIAVSLGKNDTRLQIADSKQVYQPGKGLRQLERTVLASLQLLGEPPRDFDELCRRVACRTPQGVRTDDPCEPWFARCESPLPVACAAADFSAAAERWKAASARCGLHLRDIRSEVVFAPRFNRLSTEWGNKSHLLSRLGMRLIEEFWRPRRSEPLLVICDKHGGRSRYQELLLEISDGAMVLTREEGRELSRYDVGPAEFRFQTRAEAHLPTALASMVSKYVRETAMREFNHWWQSRVPDLRPTAGYPEDAKRFRSDVSHLLSEQRISDAVFWRAR